MTAQAAQLIDPALTAGQKDGYTFALTCTAKTVLDNHDVFTAYRVTAVPQTVGKTGTYGYCADESNAASSSTPTAAPTAPGPLQ